MTTDLVGNVVWITGGARGLGRALVLAFAEEGADIAFSYHSSVQEAADTESQVRAVGVRCLAIRTDLRRVDEIRSSVKRIDETFGRLDVLINNAGVFERTPFDAMTDKQVDEMLDVNLKATLFTCQESARRLKQHRGAVINISSVGGLVPWSSYPVYCASEAAVLMATKSMALALAPHVRVNSIAPGILTVPEDMSDDEAQLLKSRIPMGKFGRFGDVVDAALFLTKSGHYITGETLVVDGGRQLK